MRVAIHTGRKPGSQVQPLHCTRRILHRRCIRRRLQQLARIHPSSCHPLLEFAGFDAGRCRALPAQMPKLACSSDDSSVRMRDLISLSTPPPCILQESLTPSPEPSPQWQTSELCWNQTSRAPIPLSANSGAAAWLRYSWPETSSTTGPLPSRLFTPTSPTSWDPSGSDVRSSSSPVSLIRTSSRFTIPAVLHPSSRTPFP